MLHLFAWGVIRYPGAWPDRTLQFAVLSRHIEGCYDACIAQLRASSPALLVASGARPSTCSVTSPTRVLPASIEEEPLPFKGSSDISYQDPLAAGKNVARLLSIGRSKFARRIELAPIYYRRWYQDRTIFIPIRFCRYITLKVPTTTPYSHSRSTEYLGPDTSGC